MSNLTDQNPEDSGPEHKEVDGSAQKPYLGSVEFYRQYEYHTVAGQGLGTDVLNQLGSEGWHVVGMTYDPVTRLVIFLLERERA